MPVYVKAKQSFGAGDLDWDANNIKVVLVDTALYTVNLSTHQYLSDIAAGARVATSANLSGKTTTDGLLGAANLSIAAVSGATVEAYVVYVDSGVEATSRLIGYESAAPGLPFTPNGSSVNITWDAGVVLAIT